MYRKSLLFAVLLPFLQPLSHRRQTAVTAPLTQGSHFPHVVDSLKCRVRWDAAFGVTVPQRRMGWSCSPRRAASTVSASRRKSAWRERGFFAGSSCPKGTK